MSILKIARIGNPKLLEKSRPVKDITGNRVKNIIHDMTETMLDAKGIGLAAPQVHTNKQIIVFRNPEDDNDQEIKITALINPKLTKISDETNNKWEGCLSIPGMLGLVKRYTHIQYEGYDMQGNIIKKKVQGMHARVVQHEYDHLMGILYIHRLVDKNSFGYAEEIDTYFKIQKLDYDKDTED